MEDEQKTCFLCANAAIFLDRETGTHLCSAHLKQSVESRVLTRIQAVGELPDIIGVAFSGGKDSTALLAALVALQEKIPARLVALTVDEGIGGYREKTIHHAKEVCRHLKLDHFIISFSDLFGRSLDELMMEHGHKACTICGILRRRALEVLAEESGIHLIATGHNQDDHAQTTLMNALSADIKKVFAGSGISSRYARRIKPFSTVSEREVTLYAIISGLFRDLPECTYAGDSLRGEVRGLLNRFERDHPGAMRNAARCEEEIRNRLKGKGETIPMVPCQVCGWPGSGEVCQVCKLIGPEWTKYDRNKIIR